MQLCNPIGYVHSLETFGSVDGPGVRFVVFLQGCALRCRYCHNPDTWPAAGGTPILPQQLVEKLLRYKPYYGAQGGVTFSGGEPLLQPDFLCECLRLCRQAGIHTCLDTAGAGFGSYDGILRWTDLVLFDAKHEEPGGYRRVTGCGMEKAQAFLEAVRIYFAGRAFQSAPCFFALHAKAQYIWKAEDKIGV